MFNPRGFIHDPYLKSGAKSLLIAGPEGFDELRKCSPFLLCCRIFVSL